MLSGTSAVMPENGGVGPERNLVLEALFVVADLANPAPSASPYRPMIAVVEDSDVVRHRPSRGRLEPPYQLQVGVHPAGRAPLLESPKSFGGLGRP
ncbi:MAG: hypothetical protein QOD97_1590 [Mycobacterium sp.]|nr:hypothetical protein [Mycobacterium sp.]